MRRALITAVVLAAACTAGLPMSGAATVARVQVSPGTADPDYATNVTVSGSGFQSVKGGFGGIYVMFGTVDAHWRPSQGGQSGVDYDYVHDAENKNNHGYLKFVSFPGGSTEAEANGGVISPNGSWQTTLVIPRATFPAVGRNGAVRQVDCHTVQCGVITLERHAEHWRHDPVAGRVVFDELVRVPGLRSDLRALLGADWPEEAERLVVPATATTSITWTRSWPTGRAGSSPITTFAISATCRVARSCGAASR